MAEPGTDPIGAGSWWAEADFPTRRKFIALFVDRIEIRKAYRKRNVPARERVIITWAQPPEPGQD
jgi:hypothetical protein